MFKWLLLLFALFFGCFVPGRFTNRPYSRFPKRRYPSNAITPIMKRQRKTYIPRTVQPRYNRMSRYMNAFAGNSETKYIDNIPTSAGSSTGVTVAIPTAGLVWSFWPIQNGGAFVSGQSLNQFPQNTTKNTRIGNKSFITHIRGRIILDLPAGSESDAVRIIFYQDRQCNGIAATVADILELASVSSWQQMDFVDQIKIISDKTYHLNVLDSVVATQSSTQLLKYIKFSHRINTEVHFNNTTGVLTGIVSNNFGMLFIATQNNVTNVLATAAGTGASSTIRTYFKDH
nr:MAG: capsid protein [Cressdnaviricota sp.]